MSVDIYQQFGVGDVFILTEDALENYGEKWRGVRFRVTSVSLSEADHPGFDEGVSGQALYDAEPINSDLKWCNSVYDWEVCEA